MLQRGAGDSRREARRAEPLRPGGDILSSVIFPMLNRLLRLILRALLWLRYRIRVKGLDRIASPDGRGVLFLANHPALIDPIILMTVLWPRFRPRVLADRVQIRRPVIHFLARRVRTLEIADIGRDGRGVRDQVEFMIEASAAVFPASDVRELVRLRPAPTIVLRQGECVAMR